MKALLALAVCCSFANANIKIAYVDMEQVLTSRLVLDKQEKLKADFTKREKSMMDTQKKLEHLFSQHEKDAPAMTKSVREKKEADLRQKAQALSQQRNEMAQEFYTRQGEIQKEYVNQCKSIAKDLAKKYDLQFVSISQAFLYANEEMDFTNEVITRLK